MPEGVAKAYEEYISNLKVYNCLAGGMGTPYRRRCGIPQGCPFSMTIVALIMMPWIMIMRTYAGISCFILADDVLILGTGIKMVSNFAKALDATHEYLHLMGAKVAPDKSYNFASCKKARGWLRTTLWKRIDSGIEVIQDFRYLGARLTSAKATCSSTLDKRWGKAIQQLRKLRYCPATAEAKAKVILAKVYAAAMYGVEAAQASPLKMANLAATVIDAFKSKNNNHNANIFSPRSPRPRTISTLQLRSSLEGCCKSGGLLAKRRGPRTDSKTSFRTMLTSISKM